MHRFLQVNNFNRFEGGYNWAGTVGGGEGRGIDEIMYDVHKIYALYQ
jgi:hypothetical protein